MLACLTTKAACAAAALAYALTCCPSAIAWSWPASGAVLRPFTVVPDEYAAGQHRGVDLAGSLGEPVLSPATGVARFAGTLPLHGRSVTIETADGFTLTLLHLGSVDVARGAIVGEGDRLGTLGSSGEAEHDVPYLHFGIRRTGAPDGYVDPLELLPARPVSAPVPAPAPTPPADAGRAAAPQPVAPTPVQVATPPAGAAGEAAVPSPLAPAPARDRVRPGSRETRARQTVSAARGPAERRPGGAPRAAVVVPRSRSAPSRPRLRPTQPQAHTRSTAPRTRVVPPAPARLRREPDWEPSAVPRAASARGSKRAANGAEPGLAGALTVAVVTLAIALLALAVAARSRRRFAAPDVPARRSYDGRRCRVGRSS